MSIERITYERPNDKKFRYFCSGCTNPVLYATEPFRFTYEICPTCQKVHDQSNYSDDNWLPVKSGE